MKFSTVCTAALVLISSTAVFAESPGQVKYNEFNANYENMLNDVGGKGDIAEISERESAIWKHVKPMKGEVEKACKGGKGAMESASCLASLDKALKEMSDWDKKLQALIKQQKEAKAKTEDKAAGASTTAEAQTDASKDQKKEAKTKVKADKASDTAANADTQTSETKDKKKETKAEESAAATGGAAAVDAGTAAVSDKDAKKPGFLQRAKQKITQAKQAIVSKFSLKPKK